MKPEEARMDDVVAYARQYVRNAYVARRRLMAKGEVTAEQVAFMDNHDATALREFVRKQPRPPRQLIKGDGMVSRPFMLKD